MLTVLTAFHSGIEKGSCNQDIKADSKMKNELTKARGKINRIDKKMAKLFTKRMEAAGSIAQYKIDNGLPITDSERESALLKQNCEAVDPIYKDYYERFFRETVSLSKTYQADAVRKRESLIGEDTVLTVSVKDGSYPVVIARGALERADRYFDLNRRVFILTDSGVPKEYAQTIEKLCASSVIYTVEEGEGSKSFATLEGVLTAMAQAGLSRSDCLVSIGGGMVTDLGGLAASLYMRGIDFYNVPTTLLAQVDASVGGKTAVNLENVKNTVGAFKQPKAVLIDPQTLITLPSRHFCNGACEVIKMAATLSKELFEQLESLSYGEIFDNVEHIITKSVELKIKIVELDERESGIRKALNFGHTIGHAIESKEGLSGMLHGECVGIGMLPFCSQNVRTRVEALLKKMSVKTVYDGDRYALTSYIRYDKKKADDRISVVVCDEIGSYEIKQLNLEEVNEIVVNSIN